jgi:hypothetical protein
MLLHLLFLIDRDLDDRLFFMTEPEGTNANITGLLALLRASGP